MKKPDNRIYLPINDRERDLIMSTERDEWIPVSDLENQMRLAKECAQTTLRKDKGLSVVLLAKHVCEQYWKKTSGRAD